MRTTRRWALVGFLVTAFAGPAAAQSAAETRVRPLDVSPAMFSSVDVSSARRTLTTPEETRTTTPSWWQNVDERALQTLLRGLTANRAMRAADAAAGTALVAFASRRESGLAPSAMVVGVHALRLGLSTELPAALRNYSIEPRLEPGGFAIMFKRRLGPAFKRR